MFRASLFRPAVSCCNSPRFKGVSAICLQVSKVQGSVLLNKTARSGINVRHPRLAPQIKSAPLRRFVLPVPPPVLPSPRRIVKKYWHVINIGIQNNLAYRVNFLFRILFGFVPLLATIYLWRAVYHGKPPGAGIGGLSLAQMTSYYLIVTI